MEKKLNVESVSEISLLYLEWLLKPGSGGEVRLTTAASALFDGPLREKMLALQATLDDPAESARVEAERHQRALYLGLAAAEATPGATPELRELARQVLEMAFDGRIPGFSLATEGAGRAKVLRASAEMHGGALEALPWKWPNGTWAEGLEAAAKACDRAFALEPVEERPRLPAAARLARDTSVLISRFRTSVGIEVAINPALPRDLDARIFGKLDNLAAMRAERLAEIAKVKQEKREKKEKEKEKKPKATPAAGTPAGGAAVDSARPTPAASAAPVAPAAPSAPVVTPVPPTPPVA